MSESGLRLVAWTEHALVKAQLLGVPRADVEEAVLSGHRQRRRNTGAAKPLVVSEDMAIAYDHATDEERTALVASLWRRG
jgi:hypothetical protein